MGEQLTPNDVKKIKEEIEYRRVRCGHCRRQNRKDMRYLSTPGGRSAVCR